MFALVEGGKPPQVACEFRRHCRGRDVETPSRGAARHSTRAPCAELAARAENAWHRPRQDRIRASLEITGLARFFDFTFPQATFRTANPAPDLFLHAASRIGVQASDCIVIEDSPAGVTAATAAGMTIGFVGGSHASAQLGEQLTRAGARAIVADLRHLEHGRRDPRLVDNPNRYCGRGASFLRFLGRLLLVLVADFVETDMNDIRPSSDFAGSELSPSSTSTNCICV